MRLLAVIFGILLIVLVAQDAFETIVLPRRVTRRIRLAQLFYRVSRFGWNSIGHLIRSSARRPAPRPAHSVKSKRTAARVIRRFTRFLRAVHYADCRCTQRWNVGRTLQVRRIAGRKSPPHSARSTTRIMPTVR